MRPLFAPGTLVAVRIFDDDDVEHELAPSMVVFAPEDVATDLYKVLTGRGLRDVPEWALRRLP